MNKIILKNEKVFMLERQNGGSFSFGFIEGKFFTQIRDKDGAIVFNISDRIVGADKNKLDHQQEFNRYVLTYRLEGSFFQMRKKDIVFLAKAFGVIGWDKMFLGHQEQEALNDLMGEI